MVFNIVFYEWAKRDFQVMGKISFKILKKSKFAEMGKNIIHVNSMIRLNFISNINFSTT